MTGRLLLSSIYMSLSLLTISCSSVKEGQPDDYLNQARELIAKQQFQLAKLYVDSVSIRFPKEYAKIREGISVMREINFAEQKRTLAFCDSMLKVRQNQLPEAQKAFTFEKNLEYETVGHYVPKTQVQDNNLGRTYLQTKVDEKGNLVLTSYYRGAKPLNHTAVRVSTPDGLFAETETVPRDGALNYTFQDGGVQYEMVCFKRKGEQGVAELVMMHEKSPVTVTLKGGFPKSYLMTAGDKKAVRQSAELSVILSDITRLLEEIRLAQAKLQYIYQKESQSERVASDSIQ